ITDPATKLNEVRHWLDASSEHHHEHGQEHDAEDAHDHGSIHSANIKSLSLRVEGPIDWTVFGIWLTLLLHRHGDKVLRVKGLLNVSDALGPVVLHGVQHVIHPPVHLEEWPDD